MLAVKILALCFVITVTEAVNADQKAQWEAAKSTLKGELQAARAAYATNKPSNRTAAREEFKAEKQDIRDQRKATHSAIFQGSTVAGATTVNSTLPPPPPPSTTLAPPPPPSTTLAPAPPPPSTTLAPLSSPNMTTVSTSNVTLGWFDD